MVHYSGEFGEQPSSQSGKPPEKQRRHFALHFARPSCFLDCSCIGDPRPSRRGGGSDTRPSGGGACHDARPSGVGGGHDAWSTSGGSGGLYEPRAGSFSSKAAPTPVGGFSGGLGRSCAESSSSRPGLGKGSAVSASCGDHGGLEAIPEERHEAETQDTPVLEPPPAHTQRGTPPSAAPSSLSSGENRTSSTTNSSAWPSLGNGRTNPTPSWPTATATRPQPQPKSHNHSHSATHPR